MRKVEQAGLTEAKGPNAWDVALPGLGSGAQLVPLALCCRTFGGCSPQGSSLVAGAPFPPLNPRLSSFLHIVMEKELREDYNTHQHWPGHRTFSLYVFILNVCFN